MAENETLPRAVIVTAAPLLPGPDVPTCSVVGAFPDTPVGRMLCWLPEGHDGDHWDEVDRAWWRIEE